MLVFLVFNDSLINYQSDKKQAISSQHTWHMQDHILERIRPTNTEIIVTTIDVPWLCLVPTKIDEKRSSYTFSDLQSDLIQDATVREVDVAGSRGRETQISIFHHHILTKNTQLKEKIKDYMSMFWTLPVLLQYEYMYMRIGMCLFLCIPGFAVVSVPLLEV